MNDKHLRSRLISAYDFKKINIDEFVGSFEPDEDAVEAEIQHLLKKHAETADAKDIAEDDFVTLSCDSEIKKFQKKNIVVKVGRGLFSEELEAQLMGLSVGDTKVIAVDGAAVSVNIKAVRRSFMPKLCDETVSQWNIEGVDTVEALRADIVAAQREEYIVGAAQSAVTEVENRTIDQSEFDMDQTELEEAARSGREMLLDYIRSCGPDYDTMTDDECMENFGANKSDYIAFIENVSRRELYCTLLGLDLMAKNNIVLGDEDYMRTVEEFAAESGKTADEIMRSYSFAVFLKQESANYYCDQIEAYIINELRERIK